MLHQLLIDLAREEGFPLAGVVDIDLGMTGAWGLFQRDVARFEAWIAKQEHGSMEYLARGQLRRSDPRHVFPEAKSMLCVALPYPRSPAGSEDPVVGVRYARYLQGPDYHLEMTAKLTRVMEKAQLRWNESACGVAEGGVGACTRHSVNPGQLPPVPTQLATKPFSSPSLSPAPPPNPLRWKVCVDTSAILEKTWAALAGLGWIGRNTLLIHPQLGSYLFLGEVLINQATGQAPAPLPSFCGNCSRCLQGCPTKALLPDISMDARRCIAYVTLEKREPAQLPTTDPATPPTAPALATSLSSLPEQQVISRREASSDRSPPPDIDTGLWVAGCDVCQEVCPFNWKPARREAEEKAASQQQAGLGWPETLRNATARFTWEELLAESDSDYRARVKTSALDRVKPAHFKRNLQRALRHRVSAAACGLPPGKQHPVQGRAADGEAEENLE